MDTKKIISLALALAAVGSFALAVPAFAQGRMANRGQAPAVVGTVSSISGTTLTVATKAKPNGGVATVYTVDASSATVTKNGAASSATNIATGDTVMIQGTITGTNVVAKNIRDGVPSTQPAIEGNGQPVVAGLVTVISGNIITITNKSVTYTINATSAKIVINGVVSPTISNITVGDNLIIQGTVNGTSVAATSVIDQKAKIKPQSGLMGSVVNFFKHLFGF